MKGCRRLQHTVPNNFYCPSIVPFGGRPLHPRRTFGRKELHAQREPKQVLRATAGKVASKQIGDELTNGRKTEDGNIFNEGGGEKGQSQPARHLMRLGLYCVLN
jgi:hypothetical protein